MEYQRLKKGDINKVVGTLKTTYKINIDNITDLGEQISVFLEKQIKKSNYKEELHGIELHFLEDYKNRDLSTLFKNIEDILSNPLNYLSDLNCMVYMAYLFSDSRSDLVDGLINEIDVGAENIDEADIKFIEELGKKAEDIAFPELGCESIKKLEIENLPLIVAVDAFGGDIFISGREKYKR